MLIGLDHIVIVVPDLYEATITYEKLGFSVLAGGKHSTGTHNALIGLRDTGYLELLAFSTPNPKHRWAPILDVGGGLADMCAMTDDIYADIARYSALGLDMEEPREMSRTKPDGTEISWRLSVPQNKPAGAVPFLIEDLTPIANRIPAAPAHANGVTGIKALRLISKNIDATLKLYRNIFEDDGKQVSGGGNAVQFNLGNVALEIHEVTGTKQFQASMPLDEQVLQSLVLNCESQSADPDWNGLPSCNVQFSFP